VVDSRENCYLPSGSVKDEEEFLDYLNNLLYASKGFFFPHLYPCVNLIAQMFKRVIIFCFVLLSMYFVFLTSMYLYQNLFSLKVRDYVSNSYKAVGKIITLIHIFIFN
jgi:hypothetical protein